MHPISAQLVGLVSLIGGFVVPPVTSFFKKQNWAVPVKQILAALVSFAVAAVALYITTPSIFNRDLAYVTAIIFGLSQPIYTAFYKGSSLDKVLTAVFNKAAA